jgi:uncharacterized protein
MGSAVPVVLLIPFLFGVYVILFLESLMAENKEIELKYPCEWVYKIIGCDADRMRATVGSIIRSENLTIGESRESKGGKYVSLNVKMIVQSETERKEIFSLLGQQSDIKMVL